MDDVSVLFFTFLLIRLIESTIYVQNSSLFSKDDLFTLIQSRSTFSIQNLTQKYLPVVTLFTTSDLPQNSNPFLYSFLFLCSLASYESLTVNQTD